MSRPLSDRRFSFNLRNPPHHSTSMSIIKGHSYHLIPMTSIDGIHQLHPPTVLVIPQPMVKTFLGSSNYMEIKVLYLPPQRRPLKIYHLKYSRMSSCILMLLELPHHRISPKTNVSTYDHQYSNGITPRTNGPKFTIPLPNRSMTPIISETFTLESQSNHALSRSNDLTFSPMVIVITKISSTTLHANGYRNTTIPNNY